MTRIPTATVTATQRLAIHNRTIPTTAPRVAIAKMTLSAIVHAWLTRPNSKRPTAGEIDKTKHQTTTDTEAGFRSSDRSATDSLRARFRADLTNRADAPMSG